MFSSIYEFVGLIAGGQYYPAESLSESQKVCVDTSVKKAYDNWMNVIEYDGEALLNFMQSKQTTTSPNEVPSAQANYSASYDQQQVSQASLSVSVPSDQSLIDAGVTVGGGVISRSYGGNQSAQYFTQTEHVGPNAQLQYESSAYNLQNQLMDSSQQAQITRNDSTGLVLAPSQQPSLDFQSMSQASQPSNLHSYAGWTSLVDDLYSVEEIHKTPQLNEDDWTTHQRDSRVDDFFSEEEIRMRSYKLQENEDMQHLLRIFSMGGAANLQEDGFSFPAFMPSPCPNYNFDEDRSRTSGKAVVGWLKMKAAMRWGIFIRKKAAERRAQLIELDE